MRYHVGWMWQELIDEINQDEAKKKCKNEKCVKFRGGHGIHPHPPPKWQAPWDLKMATLWGGTLWGGQIWNSAIWCQRKMAHFEEGEPKFHKFLAILMVRVLFDLRCSRVNFFVPGRGDIKKGTKNWKLGHWDESLEASLSHGESVETCIGNLCHTELFIELWQKISCCVCQKEHSCIAPTSRMPLCTHLNLLFDIPQPHKSSVNF